jgi:p21-activated kinase 7
MAWKILSLYDTYVGQPMKRKQLVNEAKLRLHYSQSNKNYLQYLKNFKRLCDTSSMTNGKIMLATDLRMKETVVIKVVSIADTKKNNNLFIMENEIRIMQECSHDNIVTLYDCFIVNEQVWIEMEYCRRGTLHTLLKKKEIQWTEEQIASIVKQILKGLHYLHNDRVIVHCDMKTDNILITENYEVKIADFGVSKKLLNKDQKRSIEVGTALYYAPEIVQENPSYGMEVDIWALGIVIWEMTTNGRAPYSGLEKPEILKRIREDPAPQLDREKWSADMVDFMDRMLRRDPTERYTTKQLLQHPFMNKATMEPADFLPDMYKSTSQ